MQSNLILEIGTEELPPKPLLKLSQAFARALGTGLDQAGLGYTEIKPYATSRRLAAMVTELASAQADKKITKRGPSLTAAYDDTGQPTPAALGFAKSCGVDISAIETMENDQGRWLCYSIRETGKQTIDLIAEIVETALTDLPIPKRMRWGDGDIEFIRPVHWALILYGKEKVKCTVLGVTADNKTNGHRFHCPNPITLETADDYCRQLEKIGKVIVDFKQRKTMIEQAVKAKARALGGIPLLDTELLNETTALVEWPVIISGKFAENFLQLPREVLAVVMQTQQKYFPVMGKNNHLLPSFIAVTNIESKAPELIRHGNERVIAARLADAEFFWRQDQTTSLADLTKKLASIVFQQKLGHLGDKTRRITALAKYLAKQLNYDTLAAQRAGELCKCDLLTGMVNEFPELQGIMGRYYALNNGESQEIAQALDEHYMPRDAKGQLPRTPTGQILAIADKLDTLVGMFAIGKAPTGAKDPFALRRAALGILRIIIEGKLDLDLKASLEQAAENYAEINIKATIISKIFDFMTERLRQYYFELGIALDSFAAVLARRPVKPYDFHQRLHAITEFRKLPEAESLVAANKRISNILKKAKSWQGTPFNPALLQEQAEKTLAEALSELSQQIKPLLAQGNYQTTLSNLAILKNAVDAFFDEVMVMCDDETLRNNRLALLAELRDLFLKTADLSKLQ